MIKKRVDLQIYILLAIGGAFLLFLFHKFDTPYPLLNIILTNSKYYVIPIMVMCFIPPIINLICQMSEKSKNYYDELPYKRVIKGYMHLSSILIMLFLFSWVFVFIVLFFLNLTKNINISFVISSIIILVAIFVVDALVQKHLKIKWYNFFYWVK